MTAPDPTAGERQTQVSQQGQVPQVYRPPTSVPTSPPVVAASTGTSEDDPNIIQRIVNAWDCCGTCAGGVLARHMADREAAARAEERERIAQAIEAKVVHIHRSDYDRDGCDDGCGWLTFAARIAREG